MDLVKLLIGGTVATGLGVGGYFLGNKMGFDQGHDQGYALADQIPVTVDECKNVYTSEMDKYSSIESNNLINSDNSSLNLYVCEELGLKAFGIENKAEGIQSLLGYNTSPFGVKQISATQIMPETFCNGSYEKLQIIPEMVTYDAVAELPM
ncbi:hypothetical protein HN385_03920 [archaeon]|jgi:hypothetical protein|nr:hypothetical protein [archaeon]MBT3450896.1 hypothetical protein [archaeon]MBT6869078.1 hypothetical protein [archaeon]MBT7193321.1 hypothetical protein [archaeon]MBT7380329.1 hypothetical protein [archaeon]